jgi:hypothetical protein
LWGNLPSVYHAWTDVWTPQADDHSRDTVLVGLLSKAACTNLTSLFSGNLSFQLYDMNGLQSHLNSDVFDCYASFIGTKKTVLGLAIKPQTTVSGENITITALLTNSSQEPITSQKVAFYTDSSFIGSSFTDSSGVATIVYQATIDLGKHNITAYLSGDAGYTGSLERTVLTIQANPDLNRDGIVNILDISIVARAFASRLGDLDWNAAADLNKDGIVNILDISLVARSFGKRT